MVIQTWLSCHNKFISAENITISTSRQMTFYKLYLKLQDSKCGITVHK